MLEFMVRSDYPDLMLSEEICPLYLQVKNQSRCYGNPVRKLWTTYLFSREVFEFDTFLPIADAFQENYDPDGSAQHFIK